METKRDVTVLIPVYRPKPGTEELRSIANTRSKLSTHPLYFLVPQTLDTTFISSRFPDIGIIRVSDEWLGTKNGIAGYNRMMMSEDFYNMFSESEYILICHTDAWIFRDELSGWCEKGYDIVAAPWPTRPRYRRFPLRQLIALRKRLSGKIFRALTYDRVGNGGLSLRKVSSCADACRRHRDVIEDFLARPGKALYNEDVFFALIPENFTYPTASEALRFAFDYRPALCYRLNGYRLPMGCHGYTKKRHRKFWSQFIPL